MKIIYEYIETRNVLMGNMQKNIETDGWLQETTRLFFFLCVVLEVPCRG